MAILKLGRQVCIAAACLLVSFAGTESATGQEFLGRYSMLNARSTLAQRDLLVTPIAESFAPSLRTVGDAVEAILVPTGYRLSSTTSAELERSSLLALPLPAAHRALAGLTIRGALNLLVGPAFHVIEDPIHRLISFERCEPRATPTVDPRP